MSAMSGHSHLMLGCPIYLSSLQGVVAQASGRVTLDVLGALFGGAIGGEGDWRVR